VRVLLARWLRGRAALPLLALVAIATLFALDNAVFGRRVSVDCPRLKQNVTKGVHNANGIKGRAAIVSCAKDGERLVESFMRPTFSSIGNLFEYHQVIIVESNSHDQTRERLAEWTCDAPDQLQLMLYDHKGDIAHWRNKYLEEVLRADPPFDYMVVVDSDMRSVSVAGIQDSLLNHNELHWGAMVANGVRYLDKAYYDVIALRTKENNFGWDPAHGNLPPHGPIVDWGRAIRNFTIRIEDTWPPLRVQSAFGGVGVYKVPALRGCSYCNHGCIAAEKAGRSGGVDQGFLCEHVPLSDCITRKNGFGVFLNPKMGAEWHHACADCCADRGLSCEACAKAPCAPRFDNLTIRFPVV